MSPTRRGFTLIEMVVAMALTMVVFAITLPFVRVQSRALSSGSGRLDADQVARYAVRVIDRDLRMAVNDPGQPLLVYAGPMAISFNANLVARDTLDPGAVSVESGAPTTLSEAWRVADAAALPLTSTTYPTTNYTDADGGLSKIETISYFLRRDTVTTRNDVYALYRRVNARDSSLIVRGLQVTTDSAFFSYFTVVADTFVRVSSASLPMYWTTSGVSNIRAVGIKATGYFYNAVDRRDVLRNASSRTLLSNVVTSSAAGCGAAPGSPSSVVRNKQTGSAGFNVRITWNASADDGAGASDVTHYVVNIRPDVSPVVWTPIAVVPARAASSYQYEHYFPSLIGSVKYGVHAVDCGGTKSSTVEHTSSLSLP